MGDLETGASVGFERAHDALAKIMDAQATPAQIGAFLLGLRTKDEGPAEIARMTSAMRERAGRIRQREERAVGDVLRYLPKVSARLGIEHALVVHAQAGMDEICLCCPTIVGEVGDGRTRQFVLRPADFGFDRADARDLAGAEPETAAKEAVRILRGELGPKREMLLANAAAGIYVSGNVDSLLEALHLAVEDLESGTSFG